MSTKMYVAKRNDGSFETLVNGLPYHVIKDDPLFTALSKEHSDLASGYALVDGSKVEDNRGRSGWVDEEVYVMNDFGPLPKGFSDATPASVMAAQVRVKRDQLLAETDYLLLPDYPISDEARTTLTAYRKALRDITKQADFPKTVTWPKKPVAK